jgi:hypothetical protein
MFWVLNTSILAEAVAWQTLLANGYVEVAFGAPNLTLKTLTLILSFSIALFA